ncbi:MAG: hypothetical protein ACI8VT_003283 [Saprospiraceae bacterium]|jgi:hypothetical protein
MKVKIILFAFISCLMMLGMGSCEGDIGELGPQGPDGPQGPQGISEFEDCMKCHSNSQKITAKLFQWESSVHATGGHYERSQASCAGCHTSQGFLDRLETGGTTASMDIEDPLPQNCYACHQIHTTYTEDDWAFNTMDPVTFWVGGATVDLGKGNLCINCHQARVPDPGVPPVGENSVYNLTNKRYGPHHGAQGMVFTGNGAYKVGSGYENSSHTDLVPDACITCHMASIMGGNEAGGHTFRVISEDGDLNTAGCLQCHLSSDEVEDMYVTTQSEVTILLDSLGNTLKDLGLLDDDLEYAVVPQDFTSVQLGVLWNYQYIKEDKSLGVHNAKFVSTLLGNSIEALQ